jgi:hypothetical protein
VLSRLLLLLLPTSPTPSADKVRSVGLLLSVSFNNALQSLQVRVLVAVKVAAAVAGAPSRCT